MGEFTIITGATGSGKTTFLSQTSLDFLSQKIPMLWGSFEISNEVFIETMVKQFNYGSPRTDDAKLEAIERLEQLPLHLMDFHGSTDPDEILD